MAKPVPTNDSYTAAFQTPLIVGLEQDFNQQGTAAEVIPVGFAPEFVGDPFVDRGTGASVGVTGFAGSLQIGQVFFGTRAEVTPEGKAGTLQTDPDDGLLTTLPTLEDERAAYDAQGLARTVGDEAVEPDGWTQALLDGWTDPTQQGGTNIHGGTEGDDLWMALNQYNRTQDANWFTRAQNMHDWMVTHLEFALTEDQNGDHLYGWGLAQWISERGPDPTALGVLNAVRANLSANTDVFANETPGVDSVFFQSNAGRRWARWLRFSVALTEIDPQAANIVFRDKVIDLVLEDPAWNSTWGMYFLSEGTTDAPQRLGPGAYANGDRICILFQTGLVADGMWHAWRVLRQEGDSRATLMAQRIVAMADFWLALSADAGDRLHELNTGRNLNTGAVIRHGGGGTGNGNGVGSGVEGVYRIAPVNNLVFAYKLTGDHTYLTEAWALWKDWQQITNGGAAGAVDHFADTYAPSASSPQWGNNKGELQYVYALFENGGEPIHVDGYLPSWLTEATDKTWINMTTAVGASKWNSDGQLDPTIENQGSRVTDPISSYTGGQNGWTGALEKWNGAIARENFYVLALSGGHDGGELNMICEFGPFTSEAPNWQHYGTLPDKYEQPSSFNDAQWEAERGSGIGYYTDGKPASRHTYGKGIYVPVEGQGGYGFWPNWTGEWTESTGSGGSDAASITFRSQDDFGADYDPQGTWQNAPSSDRFGGGAYDPVTGLVYVAFHGGLGSFEKYDPVTKTRTHLADPPGAGSTTCFALDYERRICVQLEPDNSTLIIYDIDHDGRVGGDEGSFIRIGYSPGGHTARESSLVYHPPSAAFIGYQGGPTLYKLVPPSDYRIDGALNPDATWEVTAIANGPGGATPPGITYDTPADLMTRFRWIESIDVFAAQINSGTNGSDDAFYVYKIPEGGL